MSENKLCPQVEIRGLGNNYGKIIQAELVSINKWSISVRFPEGGIFDFSTVSGYEKEILEDAHSNLAYSGYQLNLNSLILSDDVIKDEQNDTVRNKEDIITFPNADTV